MRHYQAMIAVILALLLLNPVVRAQGQPAGITTPDLLNLRSGPGTEYAVVEHLLQDTRLILVGRDATGGWIEVYLQINSSIRGWVGADFVESDPGVNVDALPVVAGGASAVAPVAPVSPVAAVPGADYGSGTLNATQALHSAPDTDAVTDVTLSAGTMMSVQGMTVRGDWLRLSTPDGTAQGWVPSGSVDLDSTVDINTLPLFDSDSVVDSTVPPASTGSAVNLSPPVTYTFSSRVYALFADGQQRGNNADTFIKLGDSITVEEFFLESFEEGDYEPGGYTYLQPTIDFFNRSGSFKAPSLTAGSGFSTLTILDAVWAPADQCEPDENRLMCEIRRKRPAVAFVYLAGVDMNSYSAAQYDGYLRRVVDTLIAEGVIPVMNTFPVDPDYLPEIAPLFNQVIRNIARDYELPLIDLYSAAQALPDGGVYPDEYHLTLRRDGVISFAGDQNEYGATLRELLSLQMLHDLREQVLGG